MKLNRTHIRKMILKEMSEMMPGQTGAPSYKTEAMSLFGELLGSQGLMDELDEAFSNISRIRDVAERCQSETQEDNLLGAGYVGDQEEFNFFQRMIDLCDEIEPLLDYQKFLGMR